MTREERKAYYRDLNVSAAEQDAADRRISRRARWDKRRYRTVCCRVPVERAQRFAKLCYARGITPYAAVKAFVDDALAEYDAETQAPP